MKKIKNKLNIFFFTGLIIAFSPMNFAWGTIASIVVTPADPTPLSNGLSYYLAGMTYSFSVRVVDPDITGWAQLSNVQITIPNSTNIILAINPTGVGAGLPVTVSSGTVIADADVSGTYNNCTVDFNVTIRWDTEQSNYSSPRSVEGSATTTNTRSVIVNASYGIRSSMSVLNFAQDGVAADGFVNPRHDPYTVIGIPVYNIPGATAADAIEAVNPGEITNTRLYINGADSGLTSPATILYPPLLVDPISVSYSLASGAVNTPGNNNQRVRAFMATPGGPETSANSLVVNCDEVEITGITFVNGGGINIPAYYRSITIPGTEVVVTARMRNALTGMVGITTIQLNNYIDGQIINVVIPSGSTTGKAVVPYPTAVGLPGLHSTVQNFYRGEAIVGGVYGGDIAPNGQTSHLWINQPAPVSIYWDNESYPYAFVFPSVFAGWGSVSATAYSLTFNWTGFANTAPNQDFYSYRLYYKDSFSIAYQLVDRNTPGYASMGDSTTGTLTISNLSPLTLYNYYITAVDVFGNEVPLAQSLPGTPIAGVNTVGTLASTIRVEISDGITSYNDNTFTIAATAPDDPLDRPLRRSAINVKVFIVAAGDLPDIVNIIVANNLLAGNLVVSNVLNPVLIENTDFYRISLLKTGSNEWSGYIPDTNPLITVGTNLRFIVETIKDGIRAYADNDSETETPPGNPNDYSYTFAINMQPKFTPWPTRVLNNVITAGNPKAYPSYYLTDDAYISIVIYDIKGRAVKTLLDNSFRKGGQNIKDDGWSGDNKSRKKVGIGLYYMHFKAKRASDGKVILDSFQKIVMSY
jgi:hypothetical protein